MEAALSVLIGDDGWKRIKDKQGNERNEKNELVRTSRADHGAERHATDVCICRPKAVISFSIHPSGPRVQTSLAAVVEGRQRDAWERCGSRVRIPKSLVRSRCRRSRIRRRLRCGWQEELSERETWRCSGDEFQDFRARDDCSKDLWEVRCIEVKCRFFIESLREGGRVALCGVRLV